MKSPRRYLSIAALVASTAVAATMLFGISTSEAKPFIPGAVPIDRVIQNVSDYSAKHPDDDYGHYLVGRAHYAALFDLAAVSVSLGDDDKPATFPGGLGLLYPAGGNTITSLDETRIAHVNTSVTELQLAIKLVRAANPTSSPEPLYLLTLGSITDQVSAFSKQLPPPPIVNSKAPISWRDAASQAYLRSYELAIVKDLKIPKQPLFGLRTLIAYEAGNAYIALNPKGKKTVAIKKALKQLSQKPTGAITPMIFSLATTTDGSLSSLIDPNVTTRFDLDGTGRAQRYPWVRSDTSILVWDPAKSGHITSGRQLFGTATWWMLWDNGYQALDSLDDNRDGWLRTSELRGIAVWTDANQNGVSEQGEVTPIEQTAVSGIATRALGFDGRAPMNNEGMELRDGSVRPSFDWIVDPM
jgi:hypothetical protein